MEKFGIVVKLMKTYPEAIEAVTSALKTEGFGVLTEIDVKATLKSKLNEDFRPYAILGACNPALAHKALSNDPDIGMLLPCNITVETSSENESIVRILDPKFMVSVGNMSGNKTLVEVANEASAKLSRVADLLRNINVPS
jgi:uncharacterized protein (DUF302 family)